jgi:hypothetical protein
MHVLRGDVDDVGEFACEPYTTGPPPATQIGGPGCCTGRGMLTRPSIS